MFSKIGGGIDGRGQGPLKAGNDKINYAAKAESLFEGIVRNEKFIDEEGNLLTAGKSGKVPPGQIIGNQGNNGQSEPFRYFYHPDHLGSTSYITDATGEVYQHLEYFAFGETFVEERGNTDKLPYKFNGKELDEETGLYYYGARYYDAQTSVWLGVDLKADEYPSMSSYNYVFNNPLKYIDPNGENGIAVIDTKNKTITIKAVYFVNSVNNIQKHRTYSEKQITRMQEKFNKKLNKMGYNVSEGDYAGYSVNFDLSFKAGGTDVESEEKAKQENYEGVNIGNEFSKGRKKQYPGLLREVKIINADGSTTTETVGGVTINHNEILMNDSHDTFSNILHEIFHTLFFDKDGAKEGIGRYPPEMPNQQDINDLINDGNLPQYEIPKNEDE